MPRSVRHTSHKIDPVEPITALELGRIIFEECRRNGPYKVTAYKVGCSAAHMHAMANNKRIISDRVARAFGYRRVYMYEWIEP